MHSTHLIAVVQDLVDGLECLQRGRAYADASGKLFTGSLRSDDPDVTQVPPLAEKRDAANLFHV